MPAGRSLATSLKVALLGSLGLVLMLFEIPVGFLFPGAPYLKYDLSEVPALVGGFALGPAAGVAIVLLKNLLFLAQRLDPVQLVGVPMNALAGSTMVFVASSFYWLKKSRLRAVSSLLLGTLAMTAVMIPANMAVYPLIAWIMPMSQETLWNLVLYAITPFNLFKGTLSGIITFLAYKRLSVLLKR